MKQVHESEPETPLRPTVATQNMTQAAALASAVLPEDTGLAAEFHRWPLPGYLWPALHQRYQSIFCSEPHLRVHGSLGADIQAWVARREGRIAEIMLFRIQGRVARILNEMHELDAGVLVAFNRTLSRAYPRVDAIQLHAIRIRGDCQPLWCVQTEFSEDYLLQLPASVEEWQAGLSSQTREKLRYHHRRSRRKQPDLRFRQVRTGDISDSQFERILHLSRLRMQHKGRPFNIDESERRSLRSLMGECGEISLIEIGDEIVAGLLCTRLGRSVFMHVIAHDPRHDDLRLGFLCCAMTIEASIGCGVRHFHFLWGYYDYKVRLGGERKPLYQAVLFKSWLHGLSHPLMLARQLMQRTRRKLAQWRHA